MKAGIMGRTLSFEERFAILEHMSIALLCEGDDEQLQLNITNTALEMTEARFSALILCNQQTCWQLPGAGEKNLFQLSLASHATTEQQAWLRQILSRSDVLQDIFQQHIWANIPDLEKRFHHVPRLPVLSLCGVALLTKQRHVLGYLILGSEQRAHFQEKDRALLTTLSVQASLALENASLSQRVLTSKQEQDAPHTTFNENESLRASLQRVIDEISSGIIILCGPDARVIMANRGASRSIGTSWHYLQPLQEALDDNNIQFFDSQHRPLTGELLLGVRALRTGLSFQNCKEIMRLPNGAEFPLRLNVAVLEREHWLNKMIRMIYPLEEVQRIAIITHQDFAIFAEAERAKDEFIITAAHELRTPITALRGYAQTLMLHAHDQPLEDWQSEAFQGITQSTERVSAIIDVLLDLTALQSKHLLLYPEPCDLVALARRVIKKMQQKTSKHQISLQSAQDYLVVVADPHRIEQVLTAVLDNAMRYTPQGGPITCQIGIVGEGESDESLPVAQISIKDMGIGIPQQQQGEIFQRFQHGDNARDLWGLGLSLYICRSLLQLQQGRIWFDSIEGQGSTFYITMPLYRELEA